MNVMSLIFSLFAVHIAFLDAIKTNKQNKQTKKERQAEETFLKQIFFFSAIGIVHGRFRFCPS